MVYVDPKNLGYQPYMDKWTRGNNDSDQEFLNGMREKYVDGAIQLIIHGMLGLQSVKPLKMIIPQTGLNMVRFHFSTLAEFPLRAIRLRVECQRAQIR